MIVPLKGYINLKTDISLYKRPMTIYPQNLVMNTSYCYLCRYLRTTKILLQLFRKLAKYSI